MSSPSPSPSPAAPPADGIIAPELPAPPSPLRAAITAAWLRDETEHVRELLEQARLPGTEQAQADRGHPDDAAGAEGDAHAFGATVRLAGRGGDAHVGLDRQAHAQVADGCRERGADHEEDAAPDAHGSVGGGQQHEQGEGGDDEPDERAHLPVEVGAGALLHRPRDLQHVRRAGVGT